MSKDDTKTFDNSRVLKPFGIKDVDQAFFNWWNKKLNIKIKNKDGENRKVPVTFVAFERWNSVRKDGIRDQNGSLTLPLIAITRISENTDPTGPTSRAFADIHKHHAIAIEADPKSSKVKNLLKDRVNDIDPNLPLYKIHTFETPDHYSITYEVDIWTSFVDDMNKIQEKYAKKLDYKSVKCFQFGPDGHAEEGAYWRAFQEPDIQNESNPDDFTGEERVIRRTYTFTVSAHLLPETDSDESPYRTYWSQTKLVVKQEFEEGLSQNSDHLGTWSGRSQYPLEFQPYMHFRGDRGVITGSPTVQRWEDQSGNCHHLIPSGAWRLYFDPNNAMYSSFWNRPDSQALKIQDEYGHGVYFPSGSQLRNVFNSGSIVERNTYIGETAVRATLSQSITVFIIFRDNHYNQLANLTRSLFQLDYCSKYKGVGIPDFIGFDKFYDDTGAYFDNTQIIEGEQSVCRTLLKDNKIVINNRIKSGSVNQAFYVDSYSTASYALTSSAPILLTQQLDYYEKSENDTALKINGQPISSSDDPFSNARPRLYELYKSVLPASLNTQGYMADFRLSLGALWQTSYDTIGSASFGNFFSGTIYEILIFTSSLSTQEHQLVQDWLVTAYPFLSNSYERNSQFLTKDSTPYQKNISMRVRSWDRAGTGLNPVNYAGSVGTVYTSLSSSQLENGGIPSAIFFNDELYLYGPGGWGAVSTTIHRSGSSLENQPRYYHSSSKVIPNPVFKTDNFQPRLSITGLTASMPYIEFKGFDGDMMTASLNYEAAAGSEGKKLISLLNGFGGYYCAYFSASMFNSGTHHGPLLGTSVGVDSNLNAGVTGFQLFSLSSSFGVSFKRVTQSTKTIITSSVNLDEGVHWIAWTCHSASNPHIKLYLDGNLVASGNLSSSSGYDPAYYATLQSTTYNNIYFNNKPHVTASTQLFKGEFYEATFWSGSCVTGSDFIPLLHSYSNAMYSPQLPYYTSIEQLYSVYSGSFNFFFDSTLLTASSGIWMDRVDCNFSLSCVQGMTITSSVLNNIPCVQLNPSTTSDNTYSWLYTDFVPVQNPNQKLTTSRVFVVCERQNQTATNSYQYVFEYGATSTDFGNQYLDMADIAGDSVLAAMPGNWGNAASAFPMTSSATYVMRHDMSNVSLNDFAEQVIYAASSSFKVNGELYPYPQPTQNFYVSQIYVEGTDNKVIYLDLYDDDQPAKYVTMFSLPYDAVTDEQAGLIENSLLYMLGLPLSGS